MIFPGDQRPDARTVSGARVLSNRIADRSDLTLECIRPRHYQGETSPLAPVLRACSDFFDLFGGYYPRYRLCDFLGIGLHFVLPEAHYVPAVSFQIAVCLSISSVVCVAFVEPIVRVPYGRLIVLGAPVPETPIDEHRHTCPSEQEVGRSPQTLFRTGRDPVSKSQTVDEPSHHKFRSGVSTTV